MFTVCSTETFDDLLRIVHLACASRSASCGTTSCGAIGLEAFSKLIGVELIVIANSITLLELF
jgi:hypothetical protein